MELLYKAVTYRKPNNSQTPIPISLITGGLNFQIKANNDQIWPYETQKIISIYLQQFLCFLNVNRCKSFPNKSIIHTSYGF